MSRKSLLIVASFLTLAAAPAIAQETVPAESGRQVYSPSPAQAVEGQARRNNAEPGMAREVAPDARQSATGGPSGGLPGHQ